MQHDDKPAAYAIGFDWGYTGVKPSDEDSRRYCGVGAEIRCEDEETPKSVAYGQLHAGQQDGAMLRKWDAGWRPDPATAYVCSFCRHDSRHGQCVVPEDGTLGRRDLGQVCFCPDPVHVRNQRS